MFIQLFLSGRKQRVRDDTVDERIKVRKFSRVGKMGKNHQDLKELNIKCSI